MLILDEKYKDFKKQRQYHWNHIAEQSRKNPGWGKYYHCRINRIFQHLIAPGHSVLEIGCGQGDLLESVQPIFGVGVDFSPAMLVLAKKEHPNLNFILADAHSPFLAEKSFDFIILSDLLNDVWDVQAVLHNLSALTHPQSRVIINTYSRLWELPLSAARNLGLAHPVLYQNWLTLEDIINLLSLENFEVIRTWQEILLPLNIPIINTFLDRFLVKIAPFNQLGLTNFIMARPVTLPSPMQNTPSVSIIVPARNEAGNIENIFSTIPQMGNTTELIFVEGHSKDDTYQVIEANMAAHPEVRCKLFRQTGSGKGDAVRLGFSQAEGDILMILDADLTVPPGYLPRFYRAICNRKGDFINGVRLVYPMEKQAMKFFNLLGNKFFSLAFSWLLGQPIKDTLCGTKVLWRKDYQRIAENRAYFGDFDPFGDFDLLFGAVRLGLKIVDMPVRYGDRVYGTTNIQRWKHGWLLLKMAIFAAQRIKFV